MAAQMQTEPEACYLSGPICFLRVHKGCSAQLIVATLIESVSWMQVVLKMNEKNKIKSRPRIKLS